MRVFVSTVEAGFQGPCAEYIPPPLHPVTYIKVSSSAGSMYRVFTALQHVSWGTSALGGVVCMLDGWFQLWFGCTCVSTYLWIRLWLGVMSCQGLLCCTPGTCHVHKPCVHMDTV
jgi:hypothetical protein